MRCYSALVAQLCTGALAVKEGPQAAPRQSTWITGYEHLPPPKLKNAGEERKMANTVSGNIQPTSQVAEPYVTKYMLDTDAADRPTARQAKLVQPIHSQSGIAIIAMGAAPNSGLIEHTHQCSLVSH